jgi:hypothetical protein
MIVLEGRKEDVYKRFQGQIDAERNHLAKHTLPNIDAPASFYDLLVNDRFIEETDFKYLEPLIKLYYATSKYPEGNPPNEEEDSARYLEMIEKGEDMIDIVKLHNKYPTKFKYTDFNQYASEKTGVVYLIRDWRDVTEWAQKKETEKIAKQNKEVIFDKGDTIIIVPKAYEASCYYGAGTKWCVSAKNNTQYTSYSQRGKLFFIINKSMNRENPLSKVAVFYNRHRDSYSIWDATDFNLYNLSKNEFKKWEGTAYITKPMIDAIVEYVDDTEKSKSPYISLLSGLNNLRFNATINSRNIKYVGTQELQITFMVNDSKGAKNMYYVFIKNIDMINNDDAIVTLELWRNQTILITRKFVIKNIHELKFQKLGSILREFFGAYLNKLPPPEYPVWRSKNIQSTYSFSRRSNLADSFTNYIKKTKPGFATRNGFLESIGKPTSPGMLSTFFASIKDAGIVILKRGKKKEENFYYTLGPNYKAYLEGKLRRL